jgi:hypothetical protein
MPTTVLAIQKTGHRDPEDGAGAVLRTGATATTTSSSTTTTGSSSSAGMMMVDLIGVDDLPATLTRKVK